MSTPGAERLLSGKSFNRRSSWRQSATWAHGDTLARMQKQLMISAPTL
jgi:hypothetical protein